MKAATGLNGHRMPCPQPQQRALRSAGPSTLAAAVAAAAVPSAASLRRLAAAAGAAVAAPRPAPLGFRGAHLGPSSTSTSCASVPNPDAAQLVVMEVSEPETASSVATEVIPPYDTPGNDDGDCVEAAAIAGLRVDGEPSAAAVSAPELAAAEAAASGVTAAETVAVLPPPPPPSPLLRRAPSVDLPLAALTSRSPSPRPPRPFPPTLDLQRLGDALLGEPSIGPIFNDLFELSRRRAAAGGAADPAAAGPLLYAPRFPRPAGSPPASLLPLLVYLPGIDGTGLAAYRQFLGLAARFDLRGVFLPPEDRTPFGGLVESLAQQLEDEVASLDPARPVYLLGESFGGLVALALARRLSCVDRLVLVNPATSFDRSPWPALGPLLPALPSELYRLLPVALAPLLSNPIAMAAWGTSAADPPQQQALDMLYGLLELLPELSSLRVVLPPATLAWRLRLLGRGAEEVNGALGQVRQRTLLLVGGSDLVIPSASEGPRLAAALPRCRTRLVAGGSHALLQEAAVDLAGLMLEEDFYVARRRLTRPNVPPPTSSSSHPPHRRPKPAPGGANFGTPGPLELPTPGELRRAAESDGGGLLSVAALRRLTSPVFLSTDAATGRRQLGLGGLPPPPLGCGPPDGGGGAGAGVGGGPVLFVGNHQLFAPDMPLMVEHLLRERGQLLRGLAHPTALQGGRMGPDGGPSNNRFGRLLETFGAVPVSGRNLYELLQGGEAALLYPGGVREAFKLRGERYELIWPRRAEFVRMACKFGATIVPFAAVGAEDGAEVLLDRRDLMAAPLLGEWLRRQQEGLMPARQGVTASEDIEESFVPPVVAPRPPSRFYFLFGAPIRTDPRVAGDRVAVAQLYGTVRSEVEDCLGYLLRKREQDPYKELGPRLLYEASWGWRRQAPTFTP